MKKFEYSVEGADIRNYQVLCEYLKTKGQQGWELINWQLSYNVGKEMHYDIKSAVFKREVKNPEFKEWNESIRENGFIKSQDDDLVFLMKDDAWEYILTYEGYAYVLYKKYKGFKVPIADFTEAEKFNQLIKIITVKREW